MGIFVCGSFTIAWIQLSQENADQEACCWRNLFSCINLVRILQKLTKWKHSRTMVKCFNSFLRFFLDNFTKVLACRSQFSRVSILFWHV